MCTSIRKIVPVLLLIAGVLLAAAPAHAFRCKNKLVRDGMHEQQVLAVCGEPTTARHLGFATRTFEYGYVSRLPGGFTHIRRYPDQAYFTQEVVVTEYVYNFGPRKFMRRLVFEGGVLVRIESLGYGYLEK